MGRDIMGCGDNRTSVIVASNKNREDFGPCLDPATVVMHGRRRWAVLTGYLAYKSHNDEKSQNEGPTVVRTRDHTICNRMLYH